MYYLVRKTQVSQVTMVHIDETTDGTYHEVKSRVFSIHGQFGREDYAEAHTKYKNGKITRKELNKLLKHH
jgi:hypothetical protein